MTVINYIGNTSAVSPDFDREKMNTHKMRCR